MEEAQGLGIYLESCTVKTEETVTREFSIRYKDKETDSSPGAHIKSQSC